MQHRAFRGRPCMPQRDAREGVAATTRGLADWPCCNGTRESPRATGQMAHTDRPESARGGGLTALQMKLTFLRDRDEHRAEAFRSASLACSDALYREGVDGLRARWAPSTNGSWARKTTMYATSAGASGSVDCSTDTPRRFLSTEPLVPAAGPHTRDPISNWAIPRSDVSGLSFPEQVPHDAQVVDDGRRGLRRGQTPVGFQNRSRTRSCSVTSGFRPRIRTG